MTIEREDNWFMWKISAGDFNQAHICRTVLGDEIEIHIEKRDNVLFYSHILEFFARSFPKAFLPSAIGVSNPKVKLGDNRRARDSFPKRGQESAAVLICFRSNKMFEVCT